MDKAKIHIPASLLIGKYTIERPAKNTHADKWYVLYEGRWRKVYFRSNCLFIIYLGLRYIVEIEGV